MSRVLMLEDHPDVADSIVRALDLRGHSVVLATTVAEARAAYEVDGFDVILVDYELPDGTGLNFLDTIRGSDRAMTVLWSGLDRSREVTDSGLDVDYVFSKGDPGALFDALETLPS